MISLFWSNECIFEIKINIYNIRIHAANESTAWRGIHIYIYIYVRTSYIHWNVHTHAQRVDICVGISQYPVRPLPVRAAIRACDVQNRRENDCQT